MSRLKLVLLTESVSWKVYRISRMLNIEWSILSSSIQVIVDFSPFLTLSTCESGYLSCNVFCNVSGPTTAYQNNSKLTEWSVGVELVVNRFESRFISSWPYVVLPFLQNSREVEEWYNELMWEICGNSYGTLKFANAVGKSVLSTLSPLMRMPMP